VLRRLAEGELHRAADLVMERCNMTCIVSRDPDHALEFLRECGAPFIGRIAA
jgi:hypothetical protein